MVYKSDWMVYKSDWMFIFFTLVWLTFFYGFFNDIGWLQNIFKGYIYLLIANSVICLFAFEKVIEHVSSENLICERMLLMFNLISVNIITALFMNPYWIITTITITAYISYVDIMTRERMKEMPKKYNGWDTKL